MDVVRYTYDDFMAGKKNVVVCPQLQQKLDAMLSSACFQSMPKVEILSSTLRSKKQVNRRHKVQAPPIRRAISEADPVKVLHSLLNKMTVANATKICDQIAALASNLDVKQIVDIILEQSYKQSAYCKQYIQAIHHFLPEKADDVNAVFTKHCNMFMTESLFEIDMVEEVESYDEFCNRVKSRSHTLGKLKTILDIIDCKGVSIPATITIFNQWYMGKWRGLLENIDRSKLFAGIASLELFLEGYTYILAKHSRHLSNKLHSEYVKTLYDDVTKYEFLPVKLKFKVMDMMDSLNKRYVPPRSGDVRSSDTRASDTRASDTRK